MARPRNPERQSWPVGLRERAGYFSCRSPISGVEFGIGRVPFAEAVIAAESILHLREKELPDLGPGVVSAMKRLAFSRARARAKTFGWDMMSVAECDALWDRAGRRCELTKIPLRPRPGNYGRAVYPWMASIDRLDNGKGYEFGNCRVVCAAVNIAINQFGEEVLAEIAHSLYRPLIGDRPGTN